MDWELDGIGWTGGVWRRIFRIGIVKRIGSIWIGGYHMDRIGSDRTRALFTGYSDFGFWISDIWIVPKDSWMDRLDKMDKHTLFGLFLDSRIFGYGLQIIAK